MTSLHKKAINTYKFKTVFEGWDSNNQVRLKMPSILPKESQGARKIKIFKQSRIYIIFLQFWSSAAEAAAFNHNHHNHGDNVQLSEY